MNEKADRQESQQPLEKVISDRINKMEKLRELGVAPFPYRYEYSHTTTEALKQFEKLAPEEAEIKMAGRIMAIRKMGKALFFHFQDEHGRLQGYIKKNIVGDKLWEIFSHFDLGDIAGFSGTLFTTKTGEKTLMVKDLILLAKSLHPLPEKFHGLTDKETRYRQRYVDLIANPEVREIFKVRSGIIKAIRDYLDQHGFIEVETPILQPLYGGGMAVPFETFHQKLDMKLYLRIADELYLKRLIVGGFEKVWEFCKDFRNEGMDRLHNPEFSMVELYQAYADYNDLMVLVEDLFRHTVQAVHGRSVISYEGNEIDFERPFERISMLDAIVKYGGPDLSDFDYERAIDLAKKEGLDITKLINHGKTVEAFFEVYAEPKLIQPTFIIDFPRDISPLAKVHRQNPKLAERFECFIAGLECGNAFSELNDPIDQEQRFLDQGKVAQAGDEEAHQLDHDFITALKYGMPPTAGLGIGIDRLVMLMTDSHSIRDVIFFPQMRPEGGATGPT